MGVIDTSQWKEFRVGDLFEVSYGKFIPKSKAVANGFPHVTASAENNGYSYNVPAPMFPAGSISVASDGSMGAAFYHDEPYSAGNIVSNLIPYKYIPINKNIGLFFATLIKQESRKYSWSGFKFSVERVRETKLHLPTTPSGDPDWDYMDSFMRKILEEEKSAAEQLAALAPEDAENGHFLDVSGWKEFHLYDIFHIDMGNKFDRSKMPIGDEINFVGRTGLNNGINATCGFVDKVEPYEPGLITLALGGTIGACFVQPKKFYTSQNVIVLNPKQKLSFAVKAFMSSLIWHVSNMYYDAFSNELNRHIKTDFVFWLPVTSDGQPNWAWMEQYMQQQMDKVEPLSEHLSQII